ncbi:hypothetical protein [Halarcobacter sp.]|uniref:hypothetical protein n=1 Tax=Halarcobacter sp. TaxID=2321133 RepID=UPI002AAC04F0|nr:hypothetical protein [Halarcobacter sp.]
MKKKYKKRGKQKILTSLPKLAKKSKITQMLILTSILFVIKFTIKFDILYIDINIYYKSIQEQKINGFNAIDNYMYYFL